MKRYQEGSFQQFWRREHLITNNIPRTAIEGLYLAEDGPFAEASVKFESQHREPTPTLKDGENFVNAHTYVNCPLDLAFQYSANIFSLEEWSFGIRDIQEFRGGLYSGRDSSAAGTEVYLRCEAYSEARAVDHLAAWDQGDELWMRNYYRFVDAKPPLGKAGTLIMRVTTFHPYYLRTTKELPAWIESSQTRGGREWIGDSWPSFCSRQRMDMHNLKTILEKRFANSQY